ncbi:MAG: biotin/lipoyl-containing protein, partial [Kiritimatiellia bacterium]|nr:biotin/lipoyl-containing protein [Kiritimatiellia bacterium]
MPREIQLPALGENVKDGDVVRLLVRIGDSVKADQPLLELETGKATVEVPSPSAGVVSEIHVQEGSKVRIGDRILTFADAGAPAPAAAAAPPAPSPEPAAVPPRPAPAGSAPTEP